MARLTPGILFLTRAAPAVILPCLVFYVVSTRTKDYYAPLVPDWIFAFASVLILPCLFIARIQYLQLRNRWRAHALGARMVDTPGGWPGNFGRSIRDIKAMKNAYPGDVLKHVLPEHGHIFNRRPFFEDIIITTEPHHIKAILSTDFNNFPKADSLLSAAETVLGQGVFIANGDMWKFHRSMTRPFFNRDRISDFELFDRHAEEIITIMKKRLSEGYSVDFQDSVARFTLDSATEFLFGSSVHSMATGIPYPHHAPAYLRSSVGLEAAHASHQSTADSFAEAFSESQVKIATRLRLGWLWPLMEVKKDVTDEPMRAVSAFVDPIVKEAIEKGKKEKARAKAEGQVQEKGPDVVGEGDTLLSHLVKADTDEKVIKDETINILVAGRDTTAGTLTFLFFFLATHPHVASRLRAEIMEHVGPTRMPVYDDIKHMKYLRAVINETLRLYPIVPSNGRQSINESLWPSSVPGEKPYYIPPHTRVVYLVMIMHRRTDLWGPDAEEFDPDRFLDERLKKYLLPNNFIFLPFNAGPRICLGQQFAYNEMSFMTIRMLQNFSTFTLDRDSQPPNSLPPPEWKQDPGRKGRDGVVPETHLTMYNKGGLWMKMEEAKEESEALN